MTLNQAQKQRVKEKYNFTCPICGRREPRIQLEIHHIIKKEHSGPDDEENLIPLCQKCHKLVHKAESRKIYMGYGCANYLKKIYKQDEYKFIKAINKEIHDPSLNALFGLFECIENHINLNVKIVHGNKMVLKYVVI